MTHFLGREIARVLAVSTYLATRLFFLRALALVYLVAFWVAARQYVPLAGEHGLLPFPEYLGRLPSFWRAPSLLWFFRSDGAVKVISWAGILLAGLALSGQSDAHGVGWAFFTWLGLYVLYLSLVNAGQVFYGYGWETLLLETGFLAPWLGPAGWATPRITIWLLRWVLFRVTLGAGLIKLRGDPCWRSLTCLHYHFETQPLPNPLSWYFHRLPGKVKKLGVLLTHFVELVVPWALLAPPPLCYLAGGFTALLQLILIISGNLSWLNYIALVLCLACFDDRALAGLGPTGATAVQPPFGFQLGVWLAAGLVLALSYFPVRNMISRAQAMNASYNPFHLVNTYGAFGGVTRQRFEVVLEGTASTTPDARADWREYVFKYEPGPVRRRPPVIAPYHSRLDWQMWFAGMSPAWVQPWLIRVVHRLLQRDPGLLRLMGPDPFSGAAPRFIRARRFRYWFADPDLRRSGVWWQRELVGEVLPPLSLEDFDSS